MLGPPLKGNGGSGGGVWDPSVGKWGRIGGLGGAGTPPEGEWGQMGGLGPLCRAMGAVGGSGGAAHQAVTAGEILLLAAWGPVWGATSSIWGGKGGFGGWGGDTMGEGGWRRVALKELGRGRGG